MSLRYGSARLGLGESRLSYDRVKFVVELLPAVQSADDVRTSTFLKAAGTAGSLAAALPLEPCD